MYRHHSELPDPQLAKLAGVLRKLGETKPFSAAEALSAVLAAGVVNTSGDIGSAIDDLEDAGVLQQVQKSPPRWAAVGSAAARAAGAATTDVDLSAVERIAAEDHLAVVSTSRADGSIQSSVVNAGVLAHPTSGRQVVGFVTYGKAKLSNLRRRPRACVVFRAGWRWAGVEGHCDIIGPDDAFPGIEPSGLPELLRDVFRAAGGSHGDWDEYDRVMREERRAAVLVRPQRVAGSGNSA